jgi:hypothetical protein
MAKALLEARTALLDVETKLAQLKAKCEALLLAGNDGALDKLEDELARARRQVERAAKSFRAIRKQFRKCSTRKISLR